MIGVVGTMVSIQICFQQGISSMPNPFGRWGDTRSTTILFSVREYASLRTNGGRMRCGVSSAAAFQNKEDRGVIGACKRNICSVLISLLLLGSASALVQAQDLSR